MKPDSQSESERLANTQFFAVGCMLLGTLGTLFGLAYYGSVLSGAPVHFRHGGREATFVEALVWGLMFIPFPIVGIIGFRIKRQTQRLLDDPNGSEGGT